MPASWCFVEMITWYRFEGWIIVHPVTHFALEHVGKDGSPMVSVRWGGTTGGHGDQDGDDGFALDIGWLDVAERGDCLSRSAT